MKVFCFQIIKDLVTLFPVIRDWIAEFLDDNKDMTQTMKGRNMLIEQVRLPI
jgi:inositol 1,4,5-triphosphate receptor type 1